MNEVRTTAEIAALQRNISLDCSQPRCRLIWSFDVLYTELRMELLGENR
jgi:hypothetical protein